MTASTGAVGNQGSRDRANRCEPLQRREIKQAKGADKPEPKWCVGRCRGYALLCRRCEPTGVRMGPKSFRYGIYAERDKPVVLPLGKRAVR
jgi:hypothetical protein